MRIQKIRIKNFRGFYGEKEIDFQNRPFVLLSAPNGFGKTSTIDAIEWCLTGSIGRLKVAYDNRSTNADERKKNLDGILKNKNISEKEYVEVELTISEKREEYHILRKQKKDGLDAKLSTITLNGDENLATKWLQDNVGTNFYKYHFCDVQKSFEMQNKKRGALPDLFSEFISDYSNEKTVVDNLESYVEDVRRTIENLNDKMHKKEELDSYEERIKKYENNIDILDYPQKIFFVGEKMDITQLDEMSLKKQLQQLYSFGYTVAYENLLNLRRHSMCLFVLEKFNKLNDLLIAKKNEIEKAIKCGLDKDNEAINELSRKMSNFKGIELTSRNIRNYADLIISLKNGCFTKEYYDNEIKIISEKESQINNLYREIDYLTKGNKVLKALSNIVSYRDDIILFRDVSKKCPICGSEQFDNIDNSQLLKEAEEYIKNNNENVSTKTKIKKDLEDQLEIIYKKMITLGQKVINDYIREIENRKIEYEKLNRETQDYFELRQEILKIDNINCSREQLTSIDYLNNKIEALKKNILQEEEQLKYRDEYKKILSLLGYRFENEEETVTTERVKTHVQENIDIENYDYIILAQKVNSINSMLDNKEYLMLKQQLIKIKGTNEQIKKEINILDNLRIKAQERADKIRCFVTQLENEEYASVGPTLKKYYKKLSRINAIDSIEIIQEDAQISMLDEKNKNIVNILSNGQLSVFMLSYFFAALTTRRVVEKCKIYFIDDLTACMDDVNMLAFLDLLKYQMLAKEKNMEQIFFVTCDSRICRLLQYKLEGCGIAYCELKEEDFV